MVGRGVPQRMPTPFDILIGSFYSLRTTLRIKLSTSWEDVNIVGNGLQNLGLCWAGITLSRRRFLSCHTDCHRVSYFLRYHPEDRHKHCHLELQATCTEDLFIYFLSLQVARTLQEWSSLCYQRTRNYIFTRSRTRVHLL